MTLVDSTRTIMVRELRALQRELEAYPDDNSIWRLVDGIGNSAGTLTLHLAGNLQFFVGAQLGKTGFERDRAAEFESRDTSRADLLAQVDRTIEVVQTTLTELPTESLSEVFPLAFAGHSVTTGDFLVHLATHLAFHLGQVDYHRRLVTGQDHSVEPLSIQNLAPFTGTE